MTTPAALALISALAVHMPFGPGPDVKVTRLGEWTLRVRAEPFAGRQVCELRRGDIAYQRQALVFRLSTRIDTTTAIYRVDGGPPIQARDDEAVLAHLGFALHNDDLDNPSGGLVRIPEARLAGAGVVQIETADHPHPVKFKIAGLESALDAAHKAGCGAGDFR
jgi:hypothetical protein